MTNKTRIIKVECRGGHSFTCAIGSRAHISRLCTKCREKGMHESNRMDGGKP